VLRGLVRSTVKSPSGLVPAEQFKAFQETADIYASEDKFTLSVAMPGVGGGPPKQYSYTLSNDAPPLAVRGSNQRSGQNEC